VAKTVERYRKEKEEEEIFKSLNTFNTINEINRSFGVNPIAFQTVFDKTPPKERSVISTPELGDNYTT
jgi:hypothetical protein